MFNKKTITIGIPTYNEESNIMKFFQSLKKQKFNSLIEIEEIIFVDESNDGTLLSLKQIKQENPEYHIKIIHNEKRMGAGHAWNNIFKIAKSDIIILLDADITLDKDCITNLVVKMENSVGLCASNTIPIIDNKNIFSNASAFIAYWLRSIRNYGLSQYTTMGRALAIRSEYVKNLEIPKEIIAIDLYLQCKILEINKTVIYNDKALIYFHTPLTRKDFLSQIVRAMIGHKQIKDLTEKYQLNISSTIVIREFISNSIKYPKGSFLMICCYFLLPYSYLKDSKKITYLWETAKSTKV